MGPTVRETPGASVEYDQVGNTTRVITPRGVATANADDFATRTEYDALNRPVKQYQPYDPADTRYNDANVYTQTTYDAAGRVVKTSMPASENQSVRNESTVEYFDNGWIKKSSDAWGISTTYEYDDLGAQTARTLTSADGSANRTMTWSYFPDGKLESKADDGVPVGSHAVVTDNDTTGLAKPTGTWATGSATGQQGTDHRTHAAATGSTDTFEWTLDVPADGTYSVAATYPQVTGAATDATFELTHGAEGDGHGGKVTEPAYTVNQTTGAGAWKTLGTVQLVKGDPVTVTLKPSATGKVVADAVRLVRDNSADTDTESRAFAYSYDINGNLTGINDTSSGARADDYQVTYTGLNQVGSVREALAGQETATTGYTYDKLGQPVTVAHPDQRSEYTYDLAVDPRGPLTQVSVDDLNDTAAAKVTRYTYDNLGRRATETKANGNVVTNGYFLDGALKSMREEKTGGTLVASHAYTYDNNGNKATDVASKMNADVTTAYLESTTTYSYDPADRLAQAVKTGNGAKTETYLHDDNANVVSQTVGDEASTFTYDRNRLLTTTKGVAAASYRYDPFGRQTSVVSAGLTISRTTYDGFDHIATSEQLNDAQVMESTSYKYDPLDRTASKTTGSGATAKTTDYTYLGLSSEVLGEEVAGVLTKSYQYSPWGQRLSQITHQADPDHGIQAGETGFYGYNAHTDVETVTNGAGNTVATYGYTAYGNADEAELTGIDKPQAGDPANAEPYNAYRYNAKRWDVSSGTYDMGFRDYNPGLNRFTTRDMYNGALADLGLGTDPYTGNRYAFGAGNPISMIEIDGHWSCGEICAGLVSSIGETAQAELASSRSDAGSDTGSDSGHSWGYDSIIAPAGGWMFGGGADRDLGACATVNAGCDAALTGIHLAMADSGIGGVTYGDVGMDAVGFAPGGDAAKYGDEVAGAAAAIGLGSKVDGFFKGLTKDQPQRTVGILDTNSGDYFPFISGQRNAVWVEGVERFAGQTAKNYHHVEAQAAAFMRQNPVIRQARLYIDHPGGPCGGSTGCAANLPDMLPEGVKLWVTHAGGNGLYIGNSR